MTFLQDAHRLPVTEATRRGLAGLLADAEREGLLLVTRHDQPVAAVLSVRRLAEIEEATGDLLDLALTLARVTTDTGHRTPLDDILAEFGHDRESLTGTDDD